MINPLIHNVSSFDLRLMSVVSFNKLFNTQENQEPKSA